MSSSSPLDLIIARPAWETAWRHLLFHPQHWGLSRVRRRMTADVSEILIESLSIQTTPLITAEFRPPVDFCIWVADPHEEYSLEQLLEQFLPAEQQRLFVLIVRGPALSEYLAVMLERNQMTSVDRVHVTGPGLLKLQPQSRTTSTSPAGLELRTAMPSAQQFRPGATGTTAAARTSRTVGALGMDLARKLNQATVTLIGCGRNGSQLAFQLAGLGVSTLRLIDGDLLAAENLDAMPGLTADDIGRPKVEALAERLLAFQPDLTVSYAARHLLAEPGMELLQRRTDLIVTCVDHDAPRLAISSLVRDSLTVHLDIGSNISGEDARTARLTADVRLLLPTAGCVSCVGGIANREEVLYELAAPPGALHRGEPTPWFTQRLGSLAHLNAVAVSTAIQAWLELVSGQLRTSRWYRIDWHSDSGWRTQSAAVGAGEDCLICRQNPA